MKKIKRKILIIISLLALILLVVSLFAYQKKSETLEQSRAEFAIEHGFKANELVLIMKEDLRSHYWRKEFEPFLKRKSEEITGILIGLDAINEDNYSKWKLFWLKSNLLRYKGNYASAKGSVILLGVDGLTVEIAEELKKDQDVEHAEPHYVVRFD